MKKFVILGVMLIIGACASKENKKESASSSESKPTADGAKIYKQNCELCHGADGKLMANGSKDLTLSDLDLNERIAQISKGKGVMMAFEKILSLSEIKAVAEYTLSLKK